MKKSIKGDSEGQSDFSAARFLLQQWRRSVDKESFISTSLTCKECIKFTPVVTSTIDNPEKSSEKCVCGAKKDEHIPKETMLLRPLQTIHDHSFKLLMDSVGEAVKTKESKEWNEAECIRELPTNAFGQISFSVPDYDRRIPVEYVRLSDTTDMKLVKDLLVHPDYYNLLGPKPPSLVIHILGASRHVSLSETEKAEIFQRWLLKAIKSTHAWVVTSGYHSGIPKLVGQAIRDAQYLQYQDDGSVVRGLMCMGITPWGRVKNRASLLCKETTRKESTIVEYIPDTISHEKSLSLDCNHSLFMLVDDGYRNRKRGAEIFTARLLQMICAPLADGGLGIPVINILIQGGQFSIEHAVLGLKSLEQVGRPIPLLVCEGSSSDTDQTQEMLLYAMQQSKKYETNKTQSQDMRTSNWNNLKQLILEKLKETSSFKEKDMETVMENLVTCCANQQLISICKKNDELDLALFECLLKAQDLTIKEQMSLARHWKRPDIAQHCLRNAKYVWKAEDFIDEFDCALTSNNLDMVKLYIKNGMPVQRYLTVEKLRLLYSASIKPGEFLWFALNYHKQHKRRITTSQKQLAECANQYPSLMLNEVYNLIRHRTQRFTHPQYANDSLNSKVYEQNSASTFECPFTELLLWSVLMLRPHMALYFWELTKKPLEAALEVTLVCCKLTDHAQKSEHGYRKTFLALKAEFETIMVKFVDGAYDHHPQRTAELIERQCPRWNGCDALQLAAISRDEDFVATHSAYQVVSKKWVDGMQASQFQMILSTFLVFPMFWLVRFPLDEESQSDGEYNNTIVRTSYTGFNVREKLYHFYNAPVTKFTLSVTSYMCFLLLYAWVILFAFRWNIQFSETILHIWMLGLITERTTSWINTNATSWQKVNNWWFSGTNVFWNRLDLLIVVLFILEFVLRWFVSTFVAARVILSLTFMLCTLRLVKSYAVNSYLGPKVIMVKRMCFDLLLFLMVILILLIGYSVASTALLKPRLEFASIIFRDLFDASAWNLFGQINLDFHIESCVGRNRTGDISEVECDSVQWPVPLIYVTVLFLENILLINVLIAIFSNVFNQVEQRSEQIWKYHMYFLLQEYQVKCKLPPPFSIFSLLFRFCTKTLHMFRRLKHRQHQHPASSLATAEALSAFERGARSEFLRSRKDGQDSNSTERTLTRLETTRSLGQA